MKRFLKPVIAGALAVASLSAGAAWAHKPDPCRVDHDHRSHSADYYNYYPADNYYRAGAYRGSGVSFSISFGDDDRYDDRHDNNRYGRGHDYDRDHDYGRRNGYRGREGRVINREVYDTRYRARIILTEEIVRTRRGPRLICTVDARGPQARFVPDRHLRRIAHNECSRRAEVRIVT